MERREVFIRNSMKVIENETKTSEKIQNLQLQKREYYKQVGENRCNGVIKKVKLVTRRLPFR